MTRSRLSLVLPLIAAGCASAPRITAPAPTRAPPLLAPPPPAALDWKDAPLTPGGWSYAREAAGPVARFGTAGAVPGLELRCDMATRRIWLSRAGTAAGTITVTTSYGARAWPAAAGEGRTGFALAARDPFLDQLAFSRARFAVEGAGPARLVVPSWAEPTRVIEDCRA